MDGMGNDDPPGFLTYKTQSFTLIKATNHWVFIAYKLTFSNDVLQVTVPKSHRLDWNVPDHPPNVASWQGENLHHSSFLKNAKSGMIDSEVCDWQNLGPLGP